MASSENTYRNIMKGISLFGGVQVFNILVNLVRGKLVAIFLGTVGMGISSLYLTSAQTLQRVCSLGIGLAVTKDVAATKEDTERLSAILAVVRRVATLTALGGMLVCILFSYWLSSLAFGNADHVFGFILLGAFLFFMIAGDAKSSVLQGLRARRRLARASVVGSLTGLCVGVPLYAIFGTPAIVPAMIALAFTVWLTNSLELRAELGSHPRIPFVWREHKPLVKSLISVGLVLVSVTALNNLVLFLINYLINRFGSLSYVGLWQGANSLTNQYSAVIFAALALDYLPRLIAVAKENSRMSDIANRQTLLLSLLIAPLAGLLILFAPLVVQLLLTREFEPIVPLLRWCALSMVIKAFMFPLGYYSFAKDNRKVFFLLEGVFCNGMMLAFTVLGFHFFGLIGLGYGLVVENILSYFAYFLVNGHLYGYRLNGRTLLAILFALATGTGMLLLSYIPDTLLSYLLMAALLTLTSAVSLRIVIPLISKNK